MKKTTFTLLFGLFCLCIMAQPTITATGFNPTIGDSYNIVNTDLIDAGNSGANQTWNLSGMTNNMISVTNVVDPQTTTNGSTFPDATLATVVEGNDGATYMIKSSFLWQQRGIYGNNVLFDYSDVEDMLRFPFTYEDSFVDDWAVTFFTSGYNFWRTGTTTVTADSYGTLITPSGTYENVLRVHYLQEYQDSANVAGSPYIITYVNNQYIWYKEGYSTQLASAYNLVPSTGQPITGGTYLSETVDISDSQSGEDDFLSLYPNPISDFVYIKLNQMNKPVLTINVLNSVGQSIVTLDSEQFNSNPESFYKLDMSNQPNGIYFIQIIGTEGSIETKQFIKQ